MCAGSVSAQGYYQVRQGETIDDIARRFRVSAYEIAKANRLAVNAHPSPGTRIYVPKGNGAPAPAPAPVRSAPVPRQVATAQAGTVVVRKGDSLWALATRHGSTVSELARVNGLPSDAGLEVGQVLRLPGAASPSPQPSARTSPPQSSPPPVSAPVRQPSPAVSSTRTTSAVSSRGYVWPVEGRVLRNFADNFREKHAGLDIAAPVGTEVRAVRDGTVVFAGKITTYGRMIIVQHTGGLASCYAYNSLIMVDENDRVKRGQVIARSGDPGKGDEPYLHFQLRKNGDAIDPLPWLP